MNRVRRRFLLYAMLAVFVMLTVLLGVINGLNFTMAADDADRITEMLASGKGRFSPDEPQGFGAPDASGFPGGFQSDGDAPSGGAVFVRPGNDTGDYERIGPMGPYSPETSASVRYFTFRFDKDGGCEAVAMQISAFTEDEARTIAEKLKDETVGWTLFTYRYRVYKSGGSTYVTVIDQGRELLSSYRILLISVIGEIVGLAVSFVFLWFVGKRLFKPLEESDRKQKRFIADAENEMKIPLTVMEADAETLERKTGPDDATASMRRQIKKMSGLIRKLGALTVFDDEDMKRSDCDISKAFGAVADSMRPSFERRGIKLETSFIDGAFVRSDPDLLNRMLSEIVGNSLKYSLTHAEFSLKREGEHMVLTSSNDADISENGDVEQVFDRFTVLDNGRAKEGTGLGLSFVRDAVKTLGGRIRAYVENGVFTIKIIL